MPVVAGAVIGPLDDGSDIEQFYVLLFFDDEIEVVQYLLVCMDPGEALGHLDSAFLMLHLPEEHPN